MLGLSVAEIENVSGGDALDIVGYPMPIFTGPYYMPVPPDIAPIYVGPPQHPEPIGPEQIAA